MNQVSLLNRLFPFLSWFRDYKPTTFRSDVVAGLTVAVVLVPQSMAYALLAGMPPVYGLYAAAVAPLIGALWGSLRQLATGPIAIMSLLVLTTLTPLAEPGSVEFVELAFVLAFMVGIIYLAIGLFRLGEMMFFISHSVVKGFTAAAALIIISTQLPHLFGIVVGRHEYVFPTVVEIVQGLPALHIPTFGIGLVALGIIYGVKKYNKNLPAGLIALVVTTGALALFNLQQNGIAVVGEIPKGLPSFHIPDLSFHIFAGLFGPAFVIAIVSFAETYSVGKAVSAQSKQKVRVNQEFIGQGLANLIGSFFQSYPVSGSFSRTAVNYNTGAKTGVSSVVASAFVVLSLLFLTPLFTSIPRAALAALVIVAVLFLFHPKEVFTLWKKSRHDGVVAVSVFVLALLTKPDYALLIGVVISLMFFLWKTMHPRIVRIAKDPKLNMFVNADLNEKPSCPQILQLRPDNVIYFANAEYALEHILERLNERTTPTKYLLLDFQGVSFIDITGVDELRVLYEDLKERDMILAFVNIRYPVEKVLKDSGLWDELENKYIFEKKDDAIKTLFSHLDHAYCKNTCPYSLYYECKTVK